MSKAIINHLIEELGAVVVVPDYRLCPAVSAWEGPVTDAKACLAWVHDELPNVLARTGGQVVIDVNRIATIGFSAGGTLALLLVSPLLCSRPLVLSRLPQLEEIPSTLEG